MAPINVFSVFQQYYVAPVFEIFTCGPAAAMLGISLPPMSLAMLVSVAISMVVPQSKLTGKG